MNTESQSFAPEPSVGKGNAEPGTQEWADRVRLDLQSIVNNIAEESELAARYFRRVFEFRAWTLMRKQDGSTFQTVEELCATPRPWGLGRPWGEIRPHVAEAMAADGNDPDRALQLETVPEAKPERERNRTGRNQYSKEDSNHDDKNPNGAECLTAPTAARLRAINRAPDAVKEAYREGRISQTLAAKLGPKNPDGDAAARNAEIARDIRGVKDRKQVDRIVRERLGQREDTRVDKAMAHVRRMTPAELSDFEERFGDYLEEKGKR